MTRKVRLDPYIQPIVEDIVINNYRKILERDRNTIYVGELLECSNKRVLSMKYPEKHAEDITMVSIMGTIMHIGIETLIKQYYPDAEVEKSGYIEVELDGHIYRVVGRVDAIIYTDGRRIGLEFKTKNILRRLEDYTNHITQASIYNRIFDLDETHIIYFYMERGEKLGEHIQNYYVVRERISDEKLVELVRETVYNTAHPRKYPECYYCVYRDICRYNVSLGSKREEITYIQGLLEKKKEQLKSS